MPSKHNLIIYKTIQLYITLRLALSKVSLSTPRIPPFVFRLLAATHKRFMPLFKNIPNLTKTLSSPNTPEPQPGNALKPNEEQSNPIQYTTINTDPNTLGLWINPYVRYEALERLTRNSKGPYYIRLHPR